MRGYLARRLLTLPLLLVGISLISFLLLNFAPGDAAEITLRRQSGGVTPPREAVVALRQKLGLDDPLPVRYVRWVSRSVRGDLGDSYRTGNSIAAELGRRLPATLLLASSALALAVATGIPLGVLAAVKRGSWGKYHSSSRNLAMNTLPHRSANPMLAPCSTICRVVRVPITICASSR